MCAQGVRLLHSFLAGLEQAPRRKQPEALHRARHVLESFSGRLAQGVTEWPVMATGGSPSEDSDLPRGGDALQHSDRNKSADTSGAGPASEQLGGDGAAVSSRGRSDGASAAPARPLGHTHFQIDHVFDVTSVGTVVSGTAVQGAVDVGMRCWWGPNDADGGFAAVKVASIHRSQVPVTHVSAGQCATLLLDSVAAGRPAAPAAGAAAAQRYARDVGVAQGGGGGTAQQDAGTSATSNLSSPPVAERKDKNGSTDAAGSSLSAPAANEPRGSINGHEGARVAQDVSSDGAPGQHSGSGSRMREVTRGGGEGHASEAAGSGADALPGQRATCEAAVASDAQDSAASNGSGAGRCEHVVPRTGPSQEQGTDVQQSGAAAAAASSTAAQPQEHRRDSAGSAVDRTGYGVLAASDPLAAEPSGRQGIAALDPLHQPHRRDASSPGALADLAALRVQSPLSDAAMRHLSQSMPGASASPDATLSDASWQAIGLQLAGAYPALDGPLPPFLIVALVERSSGVSFKG